MPISLLFVYNADSTVFAQLTDVAHKLLSPATYQCNLCKITYSAVAMKQEWKDYVESLPLKVDFKHRDEFIKEYPTLRKTELPAIFKINREDLTLLISAEELNRQTSVQELMKYLDDKLAQLDPISIRPDILPLTGTIQDYAWGGHTFLPSLIGIENTNQKPHAELWLGAHHQAPAQVEHLGSMRKLHELIGQFPREMLGPRAESNPALPYLFKILDVRQMLSIQAHPNKRQAEEGFAKENAAGLAATHRQRNYKDDNHKPEIHVALTDFWLLHGFRPIHEIVATLGSVPEFATYFASDAIRLQRHPDFLPEFYQKILNLPQEAVDSLLSPLIERIKNESPTKDSPDFWALRAAHDFMLPDCHFDKGIMSIYLLNLVRLHPGEGTFQSAGTLHAYLEGVNVELMASSDNVLRGGLTPKHVDPAELMNIVDFRTERPEILSGTQVSPFEKIFLSPVDDFALSRLDLPPHTTYSLVARHGPDTMVFLEGEAEVRSTATTLHRTKGEACFISHDVTYEILTGEKPALIFRASLPKDSNPFITG
jgi:mannose-6-phosphate isomerase